MKKTIALMLLCVCCLSIMGSLIGCAGNTETTSGKTAVCVVVGAHANSQGLNLNSPLIRDTLNNTIRGYGYISIVCADGDPEVVYAASYDIAEKYKSASKERLDMDARSKASGLLAEMQRIVADDPEVDYMASIRLALRSLASLEGYDSKSIIVIGSGISTCGVLDFNNNLISADSEAVVELLEAKSEIPDFNGITVYWQQMGDVAAPQSELTSAQRIKLQDIYKGIVEAGGGSFVCNDIIPNPVDESTDLPSVTPVELPADDPIRFDTMFLDDSNADSEERTNAFEQPVFLTEEQVTFIGDKAEYVNPNQAMETLRPIADYLIKHNSISVLLVGTTAGDDTSDDRCQWLSLDRAETVKNTLCSLGVERERISVVGLGSSDPWHIYGAGYEGAAAAANRKVVILDATSDTAIDILAKNTP